VEKDDRLMKTQAERRRLEDYRKLQKGVVIGSRPAKLLFW